MFKHDGFRTWAQQSARRCGVALLVVGLALAVSACSANEGEPLVTAPEKTPLQRGQLTASSVSLAEKTPPKVTEEPLYGKSYRNGKLTIQVRTFGCTTAKSFKLSPSAEREGWLTVWRTQPDYCRRAPMITFVTLTVPDALRAQLRAQDLESALRLTNVEVPTAGLPVIPSAGNP